MNKSRDKKKIKGQERGRQWRCPSVVVVAATPANICQEPREKKEMDGRFEGKETAEVYAPPGLRTPQTAILLHPLRLMVT